MDDVTWALSLFCPLRWNFCVFPTSFPARALVQLYKSCWNSLLILACSFYQPFVRIEIVLKHCAYFLCYIYINFSKVVWYINVGVVCDCANATYFILNKRNLKSLLFQILLFLDKITWQNWLLIIIILSKKAG